MESPVAKSLATLRRWLRVFGLLMLTAAALGLIGIGLGIAESTALAIGPQSGFRTLAEIAVIGCLLAAIGYWNE